MLEAYPLDVSNIDKIEQAYTGFRDVAVEKYSWHDVPVEFHVVRSNVLNKNILGILVMDTAEPDPVGFMLYVPEPHRAIEINLVWIPEDLEWRSIFDTMMMKFLEIIRDMPGWDCVSYPMLGIQERFVWTTHWYGLMPVGQTIQKFDLTNEIAIPILGSLNQTMEPLPDGYKMIAWGDEEWKPGYVEGVAKSISEAFGKANDSRWDPRFRTVEGSRKVAGLLSEGHMGLFLPDCTSVLLHDDEPVGFCFMLQTDVTAGNIPLIGIRPSERKRGLGKQLLRSSLIRAINAIMAEKLLLTEITATVDTDNYFALKMYRRFGFQETVNYPHCYLDRDTARDSYYGKKIFQD